MKSPEKSSTPVVLQAAQSVVWSHEACQIPVLSAHSTPKCLGAEPVGHRSVELLQPGANKHFQDVAICRLHIHDVPIDSSVPLHR